MGKKIIKIRQNKYLNNRIKEDHRAIKRKTEQIQTFKPFFSAKKTLTGIEVMHALTKILNE